MLKPKRFEWLLGGAAVLIIAIIGYNYLKPSHAANADINGDGKVNVLDLSIMASNWGKTGQSFSQGDLNSDHLVNVLDLSILAANWGVVTFNVPIPSSGAYWGVIRDANYAAPGPNQKQRSIQQGETDLGRYYDVDRQFFRWNDLAAHPIVDNTPGTPDNTYVEWTADNHHIPFINLVATNPTGSATPFASFKSIAQGTYDQSYLIPLGQALKTWGKPAFFTFHHEPENELCNPDGSNASSCYGTDQDYIDAYRHIHDVFIQQGANNLSFVWTTGSYRWENGPITDYRYEPNFYPGNAYVDWIGVDPFNFVYTGTPDFNNWKELCVLIPSASPPAGCPTATSRSWYIWSSNQGKPLMLGAFGVIEDPNNTSRRANWLTNAQNYIKSLSNIKAVIYYDEFPPDNSADTRIFLINGNPLATQAAIDAYKAWGLDPYFNTR